LYYITLYLLNAEVQTGINSKQTEWQSVYHIFLPQPYSPHLFTVKQMLGKTYPVLWVNLATT